ncbi:MAG: M20 metallopeptidase family protein [Candidatus Hodarchaeales archaeon]|jgi:amidohydrolase
MNAQELKNAIITDAKTLEDYVIKKRRLIHMHPELALEEEQTASLVEEELHKIGYETQRAAKTGVIAILQGASEGKTVALRADMDALKVPDEKDVPYKSQIPGKHHACGHDSHTAMLLGAARILFDYRRYLKGTVKLLFQPAEEDLGGAEKIIDAGHLDDVDVIFGLHVWAELPSGVLSTRRGAMLASCDDFLVNIVGKGGHSASPHEAVDPTVVVADIYGALQKLMTREVDPFANAVLTTPVLQGSNAANIIPSQASLRGTLRTMDPQVRLTLRQRIPEIIQGYSQAWRCEGSVEFSDDAFYPVTMNNPQVVDEIATMLEDLDIDATLDPSLGSEDFSFYTEKTKGAFIALGIKNEEKGIIYPHHHPKFDVDEEVLWKGTAAYAILGFFPLLESNA